MNEPAADATEPHRPARRRGFVVLAWILAVAVPAGLVAVLDGTERADVWLVLLTAVLIAVVTVLGGFLAGAASAVVTAAVSWGLLQDSGSNAGLLELALVIGGTALAFYVEAGLQLRARGRLRAQWLAHLNGLSADLADLDAGGAVDAQVLAAATRATGAVETTLLTDDPLPAGDELFHVLPLSGTLRRMSLGLRFPAPPPPALAAEFAAFVRSVADQCGQALGRAELVQSEHRALADLEQLERASAVLASSLEVERVVAAIDDLVVPYLADECTLSLARRFGQAPSKRTAAPDDDDRTRTFDLVASGRLVGRLTIRRSDRPFTATDQALGGQLAARAAMALEHALLFAEQSGTSSTLEHSLLPEALLPVEHLQVAARYLAAAEGHAAGGDFYDVLRVPGGEAVLVVGDVQGKGVLAATLTSVARHTLRAGALGGARPAEMLDQLNEALLYGHAERMAATGRPSVRFVTAAVALLEPTATGFRATVAGAGHPPPLVIRPDGAVAQVVAAGPLLGVFEGPTFEERTIDLSLADLFVLYTDGVTELREQPDLFNELQLGRLVRNMLTAHEADDVAQLILDTVVELAPREVRDDIALVVARVTGPR